VQVAASRIIGLDVARGLAILGMFAAHTVIQPRFSWSDPGSWGGIVDGRSSILFAVLAGISLAIISGRRTPLDGLPLVQARTRILVRAVIVFAIGGVLSLLGSGIAVILEYYAVIFVLSLPFLRWSARRLFAAAAVWAFVGPVLVAVLKGLVTAAGFGMSTPVPMGSALFEYLTGVYPVLTWVVFMFVGLGVGRLAIESRQVQGLLVGVGAALAAAGYAVGSLLGPLRAVALDAIAAGADGDPSGLGSVLTISLTSLLGVEPHQGTPFEVVASTGFALAVIGLCLLATRVGWLRFGLRPLASIGQMALTIYTAQIIAFWITVVSTEEMPDDWAVFWWFAIVSLVVATLWRTFLGQGPLERLLSTVARRTADPSPRARPTPAGDPPLALLESPVRPGEGATAPSSTTSKENHPHG
jgi:uncharacterized membrane protein YeiB